ncbi:MAG: enoyl-CoA hydratase/isomerase family protein [Burkholderiales bacterium]|nr:enoyl-CoA hydratase/isomerase family protein [Burkholderiales bacterium]
MSEFSDYAGKYETIKMRREDGILEMRFHTNDGPCQYVFRPTHGDFEQAFLDVARDRDNEVIIMTGTGEYFLGPTVNFGGDPARRALAPAAFDPMQWEAKHLIMNLLNIEVPVISAINGPVTRHPEIPLLADVVLASDDVIIQDSAHFQGGMVPGDGVQITFPMLMGTARARYFLTTGQAVKAQQAYEFGLVNELLSRENLLPRAWELARTIMKQPPLVRRYTRLVLTQPIKEAMQKQLALGLALEGLARMKD